MQGVERGTPINEAIETTEKAGRLMDGGNEIRVYCRSAAKKPSVRWWDQLRIKNPEFLIRPPTHRMGGRVDRARIELATHGFSGRCSTD